MNVTILHGFVGYMGELKRLGANQTAVVLFSVSTKEYYKGETKTTWHQCKAFGGRAESIAKYFRKGSEIVLVGRYEVEQWTDKSGEKKTKTVLIVNSFDFVGTKQSRSDQAPDDSAPPRSDDDAVITEDELPF